MQIDDVEYHKGRSLLATGGTLRDLVERLMASNGGDQQQEYRDISFAIGFGDGLLQMLRNPLGAVSPRFAPRSAEEIAADTVTDP